MKAVTGVLLASCAGLWAGGVAAADLPARKAAPVEYVRVCSAYGEGFFFIPGTEGCLRVGGRVRAELVFGEPYTRRQDTLGFRARGRVQLDHRQATAYGTLRSFVRYEVTNDSGTPLGVTGASTVTSDLAQAFIQFGALTAGRTTSFFDNPDLPTTHFGTLRFSDAPDVNLFAYTYSFGNGFSATIAVEDAVSRRVVSSPVPGTFPAPFVAPYDLVYGGQRIPDLVGNVRYAGTWGSAQVSGVVRQIRDVGVAGGRALNPLGVSVVQPFADTEYGFAVNTQVGINLPFLGAGDTAWFAATYASGALSYLGFGSNAALGTIDVVAVTDGYIDPITGDVKRGSGWSLAGGLTHNWTPTVRSSLFGSYARVSYDGAASVVAADGASIGFVDFSESRIGTNTIWSPVSGLDIGVEVIYAQVDPRGRVAATVGSSIASAPRLAGSDSFLEGRLRVQRDF